MPDKAAKAPRREKLDLDSDAESDILKARPAKPRLVLLALILCVCLAGRSSFGYLRALLE